MTDTFESKLQKLLGKHAGARLNPGRRALIRWAVEDGEVVVSHCGALATWTPRESTGRSPKDTVTVRRPESESRIDWDSPNNLAITSETFDMLVEDALATLAGKPHVYMTERVVGADPSYGLVVRTVTDRALTSLFTDNMFRPVPETISASVFRDQAFTLLVVPYDKLDGQRYQGRLRKLPETGRTTTMAVAMDHDRRLGVVYGSAYCGSVKKLIFTVMNYLLPGAGILPLHCSANEGPDGDIALLLGLSGTGKTTLSADPHRALLGDDEHGWSDTGVANFEYGCYAKLINLDPAKEPEIYQAVFHEDEYANHGAIVENAMLYPWGEFDLFDDRLTPNSRASYPLSFLANVKPSATGGHPSSILFLTADANGVLPPIARLSADQAMLWFLMGYTSKLAGTETGIIDPKSTFSRFFGEPFMPLNPDIYASMLGDKLCRHQSRVYLVNTGWSGGPFGIGARMDIRVTRKLVEAALDGSIDTVEYRRDPIFHVSVPVACPGLATPEILDPRSTWADPEAYDQRARKLAGEFRAHFQKAYGSKGIAPAVAAQCPGA